MNVLIIEDEKPAAKFLMKLIKDYDASIEIIATLDSVKGTIEWFNKNTIQPDLIFMDIQLGDGLSFEIFEHVNISSPIIFTTAYDEYALKAFRVNSIDYLLKPIGIEDLTQAISKWKGLTTSTTDLTNYTQIEAAVKMLTHKHKSRFLVKIGEHIKSIPTNDILYFFSRDKATYCSTIEAKTFLLDYPLDQLEKMIDPEKYFRINRKYIISAESFTDIISYSNSRLKIQLLNNSSEEEVIVSRDRVVDFKNWLDR